MNVHPSLLGRRSQTALPPSFAQLSLAALGARPEARTRMVAVTTTQVEVLLRHGGRTDRQWAVGARRRNEPQRASNTIAEKLATDLKPQQLTDGAWHGVANLTVGRRPRADNLVALRERLEPTEFLDGKETAPPVERTRGGTRLSLDRPRRLVLREL